MTIDGLVEKLVGALVGSVVTLAIYLNNLRITRIDKQAEEAKLEREKAKKEIADLREESKKGFLDLRSVMKKESDELCERIEKVEEVDKTAYPAFKELLIDHRALSDTVYKQHETRLQGLATADERLGENFTLKLDNAVRRVDGLEKRLDKIDDKLDRIMEAIGKIPHV